MDGGECPLWNVIDSQIDIGWKHGNEQSEQSQAATTLTNGITKPMPPK